MEELEIELKNINWDGVGISQTRKKDEKNLKLSSGSNIFL